MNPTVETDLIGDLIEIRDREWWSGDKGEPGRWIYTRIGRGRVRAVTSTQNGHMVLWLEVTSEEDQAGCGYDPRPEIGDIVCVNTASRHGDMATLRLIEYSK